MKPFELPVPPPPPPSSGRSVADAKPLCKYGKACYNKSPGHLAKFAHPWLDDAAAEGSAERARGGEAAASFRRISTPPRANELMAPRSSATPPRSRSPREDTALPPGSLGGPPAARRSPRFVVKKVCKYGKACRRKNPEHFEEFEHPGLDEPSDSRRNSPRPPEPGYCAPCTSDAANGSAETWGSRMDEAFEKPEPPHAPVSPSNGGNIEYWRPKPATESSGTKEYWRPSPASESSGTKTEYWRPSPASESSGTKYKYTPKARGESPPSAAAPADGGSRYGGTAPTAATTVGGSYNGSSSYSPYAGGSSHRYSGATALAAAAGGSHTYSHGSAATGSPYAAATADLKIAERGAVGGSSAGHEATKERWGHARAGGASYGGPSYPGATSGAGSRSGYGGGLAKTRSKSSEDLETQDLGAKFADMMSKAREKSSTLMSNGMVSKLQASVGFIWTVNVILLFAAIVQVV